MQNIISCMLYSVLCDTFVFLVFCNFTCSFSLIYYHVKESSMILEIKMYISVVWLQGNSNST